MDHAVLDAWEQAARLFTAGQFAAARTVLESMLARDPRSAAAWLALVQVDLHTGNVRSMAEHGLKAATLAWEPKVLCEIAAALLTVGEVYAARDCLDRAALNAPTDAVTQQRIALQYQNAGMHDEALAWMQNARASGLDDPASRFCLAVQLTFHARNEEAERLLESCGGLRPPFGRAMAQLAQLCKQTPNHNHLQLLAQQVAQVQPGTENHAALEFARYKEFEDLEQYEDAWRCLRHANGLMRELVRHDSDAEERTFRKLAEWATTAPMKTPLARRSGSMPIFIIGLPRSGTTLLERLLGNHSDVRPAGELGTFRRSLERAADCFTGPMLDEGFVEKLPKVDVAEVGERYLANSQWRANGCRYYVDKMPRNWLLAPLIHAAIPQAHILHMTRDPVAVAFSNYRSYFGPDYPYSYDEDSLVRHYAQYRRLMRQWHAVTPGAILDVSYQALVSQPHVELRRVLNFCGLEWQPECVDPARNEAPVATLSAVQVRDAIHTGMSNRWRRYQHHLTALRDGIAAAVAASDDG